VPFVDRVRPLIDLREQVVSFQPQPVITEDNLVVHIDTVLYFQVTNPMAAAYEIANYIQAIEQLTVTTLRNVIGAMDLEKTLTSREHINSTLCGVLEPVPEPLLILVGVSSLVQDELLVDRSLSRRRATRSSVAILPCRGCCCLA
jgi:regulator of protease activity HflC (stomatin/prohibitin superfamily)